MQSIPSSSVQSQPSPLKVTSPPLSESQPIKEKSSATPVLETTVVVSKPSSTPLASLPDSVPPQVESSALPQSSEVSKALLSVNEVVDVVKDTPVVVDIAQERESVKETLKDTKSFVASISSLNIKTTDYSKIDPALPGLLTKISTDVSELKKTAGELDALLTPSDTPPDPEKLAVLKEKLATQKTALLNDVKKLNTGLEALLKNDKGQLTKRDPAQVMKLYSFTQGGVDKAFASLLKSTNATEGYAEFVSQQLSLEFTKADPNPQNRLESLINLLEGPPTSSSKGPDLILKGINQYLYTKEGDSMVTQIDAMITKLNVPELAAKMGDKATDCKIRLAIHPIEVSPSTDDLPTIEKDILRLQNAFPKDETSRATYPRSKWVDIKYNYFSSAMENLSTRITGLVDAQTTQKQWQDLSHRLLLLPKQDDMDNVFVAVAKKHSEIRSGNDNDPMFGKDYTSITLDKNALGALTSRDSKVCLANVIFGDPEKQASGGKSALRYTGNIQGSQATRITGKPFTAPNQTDATLLVGHETGTPHSTATHIAFAASMTSHYRADKEVTFSSVGQDISSSTGYIKFDHPLLLLSLSDDWRP